MIELFEKTASDEYKYFDSFSLRLDECNPNIATLLGAGIGLSGEVGEFNEILKKHVFQGKDFDEVHAKKELGDILWYFLAACYALNTTPEEIYTIVSDKLHARYSTGKFTIAESENRKEDDV
jgi:hypothetical protein